MNTTDPVLRQLHDGYESRCRDGRQQKRDWREMVAPRFPPVLKSDDSRRPNLLLAEVTGDMGLALLWIVQAALIRPCLKLHREQGRADDLLYDRTAFPDDDLCLGALAHSEDRTRPLMAHATAGDDWILDGTKKYITGGDQADFILATARRPEDSKVSAIYRLDANDIGPEEMTLLNLGGLYTINHGRLNLTQKKISGRCRLPLSGSQVRRFLTVWGLVERGLIIETLMAALVYLARRLTVSAAGSTDLISAGTISRLSSLIAAQTAGVNHMIHQAVTGRHVQWPDVNLSSLPSTAEMILQAGYAQPLTDKALILRLEDVKLILSFRR